ncbi:FabD/lysophospholipase-like protein [Sporormia fimetaria CBS 119925]|uniref:FabD/lysophospholipase-like protein n=1 Tax=Sporormia fimetaria CBS 119925 TaxID=1340428 RepID=A0A6A6V7D4_9PLEO|nr:FabD/lysophospholipase-like protein [Sporormia fimetaria CBS 119925]
MPPAAEEPGFSADYVRENYTLIAATVEDAVCGVSESDSRDTETKLEHSDVSAEDTTPFAKGPSVPVPTLTSWREKLNTASLATSGRTEDQSDKTGRTWVSSVVDENHERLFTLDGGGVKSYSSLLILQRLMEEIAHYERTYEQTYGNDIVLVATRSGQMDDTYLLRTYDHVYDPHIAPVWVTPYNTKADDIGIWQAARATTAAPFYFKPLKVSFGDLKGDITFKDGGIRENNPSYTVYSENASLKGDEFEPSILLSVGAGYENRNAFYGVWPGPFGRLNVSTGLTKMRLDTWESGFLEANETDRPPIKYRGGKTLNKIRIATEAYLDQEEVDKISYQHVPTKELLKQAAEKLVRLRRAREFEAITEGGEKRECWEVYMGRDLPGEREFFRKYMAQWDSALLGRKDVK